MSTKIKMKSKFDGKNSDQRKIDDSSIMSPKGAPIAISSNALFNNPNDQSDLVGFL
jgi:hypothetical protein